jgi:hypothetical protein
MIGKPLGRMAVVKLLLATGKPLRIETSESSKESRYNQEGAKATTMGK